MLSSNWVVNVEHINGHSTDSRCGAEQWAIPAKMLRPAIASRMKQSRQLSCVWVDAGEVWPLTGIATETGTREVRLHRRAAMLLGDDVIDAKGERVEFGSESAVLARVVGACKYELA